MDDKQTIETIVRNIAASFPGADSTKDWTDETIWFDVAPLRVHREIKGAGKI